MPAHTARLAALLLLLSVLHPRAAHAAGDPARGADVFAEECGDCHSAAGANKKGPSLAGVDGRRAGTVPGFNGYSEAMKSSGIVWSAAGIDRYIAAPRRVVPGGRMKYDGLADAARRADVIAFVLSLK